MAVSTLVAGLTGVVPARAAALIQVNTLTDELNVDGDCSVREALIAANGNLQIDQCSAGTNLPGDPDTVSLPAGTITLEREGSDNSASRGDLDVTQATIVVGQGSSRTIVQAGTSGGKSSNGIDRVFDVVGTTFPVSFRDMTIRNGRVTGSRDGAGINRSQGGSVELFKVVVAANNAADKGGGLFVNGDLTVGSSTIRNNLAGSDGGGLRVLADLALQNSTVSGNLSGGAGGGINATGTVATNTTISGNRADDDGGGIFGPSVSIPTTLTHVTIAYNRADSNGAGGGSGGGIFSAGNGGGATSHALTNVIVANNNSGRPGSGVKDDCNGVWHSGGGNVIENTTNCDIDSASNLLGIDPSLLPLADNGGATRTHSLLNSSLALDGGVAPCAAFDQRGAARPADSEDRAFIAECDSGAFEMQSLSVIAPAPIIEGDSGFTPVSFEVRLSSPALKKISFFYRTDGIRATDDEDFESKFGIETIPKGAASAEIEVPVFGDRLDEDTEVFRFLISSPQGAAASQWRSRASIVDDDPTRHARTVTLTLLEHIHAFGDVTVLDSFTSCGTGREVRLQRRVSGSWSTVSSVTTDDLGHFEVELADQTGRYRALAVMVALPGPDGGDICRRAVSPVVGHTH
ncbi:MAG: CSLREA domain-containing protein [Actinomycetota bacterium]|nr:CSLREA domain-containing protein [Actinomycetota bacterium]